MRSLFWFLPAIAIPLVWLQLAFGQPSSTATVDTQEKPLPPLTLLPQTTPVAPPVSASHPPTSAKKQSQKVIVPKRPPKAKVQSSNNEATPRAYTALAIEIRAAIAQNVTRIKRLTRKTICFSFGGRDARLGNRFVH